MSNRFLLNSSLAAVIITVSVSAHAQEATSPKPDEQPQKATTYNKDMAAKPLESVVPAPSTIATAQQKQHSPAAVVSRGGIVSVQVNVDGDGNIVGDAANEPSIAVDPTDPSKMAIGWRQFDTISDSFRQAGVAYTTNGGATWTYPGVLDPGQFRSDPVLGSDANGFFFYSSLSSLDSIEVFTSADGGMTWGAPVPAFGGDKQWIAVARNCGVGSGHFYQIWNVQFSCCGANDFTRTSDQGVSYDGPYAVTTPSMKWGTMDVGPDGTLYLAGATLNGLGHLFTKSTIAQNSAVAPTFDTPTSINLGGTIGLGAGPNPAGLLGQVWVAVDQSTGTHAGNIYVLNSVDPAGTDPLDVNFIRSEDGGTTWTSPIRVNDDPAHPSAWQWLSTMSVAPNGRIDVVFADTRTALQSNISEIYYTFSTDAGDTWSTNVAITPSFDSHVGWPQQNKMGDYFDMVSESSGAFLTYAATFNGEQDVYFAYIPADCNENGVADDTDISGGTSQDCNGNGVPDECDLIDAASGGCDGDCNTNSIPDDCDIASGTSEDCNNNGTPDSCDIANGTSQDVDLNGEPDECVCVLASAPTAELMLVEDTLTLEVGRHPRALAFSAGDSGRSQAIRVTYDDLPPPYGVLNGTVLWVGPPLAICETPGTEETCSPSLNERGTHFARLQCQPHYSDWSQLRGFCVDGACVSSQNAGDACTTDDDCPAAIIHVTHPSLVPTKLVSGSGPVEHAASYRVEAVDQVCDESLPGSYSAPLMLTTSGWGDITGLDAGQWVAPDNRVSTFDALGIASMFTGQINTVSKVRFDIVGASTEPEPKLDLKISALDIVYVLGAFQGEFYPFPPEPTPICP